MLTRYEKFLQEFDARVQQYFSAQEKYIKCSKGCCYCCEIGEYPFSRLEAEYLMKGFLTLPPDKQKIIKQNISKLKTQKIENKTERFNYRCPFLVDKLCALYDYRGITCRVFGLAYNHNEYIQLPECANYNLNYSSVYNTETKEVSLNNPINEDLHIDKILRSPLAEKYQLECGEIRPLINWFI